MKLSKTLFLSSLIFISQNVLQAEVTGMGRHEITIHTGGFIYEGSSKAKSPRLLGVRYGRYLTNETALEISLFDGRSELKNCDDNANVLLPTLHGLYHLSSGRLRPFVQAGVGTLKSAPDNGADSTHTAAQIGGGAKWTFTPSILARVDAAYVYDLDSGSGQNNLLIAAGLGWRFDNPFGCSAPKEAKKIVEPAKPIEVAEVKEVPKEDQFVMRDVRFAFNSITFDTRSRIPLETLFGILNNNPGLKIEIDGHTDNRGPISYNQTLSERRAHVAEMFLVEKGVAADRIATQGFGLTRPIASNQTVEGRAINRRVEFTIIRAPLLFENSRKPDEN